jgi:hypothetical protein
MTEVVAKFEELSLERLKKMSKMPCQNGLFLDRFV